MGSQIKIKIKFGGKTFWGQQFWGVKKFWDKHGGGSQQNVGQQFLLVNNIIGQQFWGVKNVMVESFGDAETERSACAMGKHGPPLANAIFNFISKLSKVLFQSHQHYFSQCNIIWIKALGRDNTITVHGREVKF